VRSALSRITADVKTVAPHAPAGHLTPGYQLWRQLPQAVRWSQYVHCFLCTQLRHITITSTTCTLEAPTLRYPTLPSHLPGALFARAWVQLANQMGTTDSADRSVVPIRFSDVPAIHALTGAW